MRISDWSSDVCSSDLARRPARRDRNIGRNRKEEEAVMTDAYICDFARTPFGRYAGSLKDVRTDDLAAHPLRVLRERNSRVDWAALDDCYMGCANQAGEDNRNVARMATLLAGFPVEVPGATVNRLCGSGLDAVRSEEHTSELQSLMRISYAVFCL